MMSKEQKSTHQSSALVEQAIARISELRALADEMTEVLGLPEEYRYAVLSGLAPLLLEDYWEREQGEAAPPSSSHEESDAPEREH